MKNFRCSKCIKSFGNDLMLYRLDYIGKICKNSDNTLRTLHHKREHKKEKGKKKSHFLTNLRACPVLAT